MVEELAAGALDPVLENCGNIACVCLHHFYIAKHKQESSPYQTWLVSLALNPANFAMLLPTGAESIAFHKLLPLV